MRGVIAALVLAAAIVGGSLLYTNRMVSISEELLEINSYALDFLENDDYEGAAGEIEKLREYIDDKRTFLTATGNHQRLDEIEMNLSELLVYTKGGQHTDALSRCLTLNTAIEYLPRDYMLTIENVL